MISLLKNTRFWLTLQILALLWGNYVGWSAIVSEVQVYCDSELQGLEALLTFNGTATTNPLLTACFWGSIVFTISLGWTIRLLLAKDILKTYKEFKKLLTLLAAGVIFALVNNIPLFYRFYSNPEEATVGCSPNSVVDNPFATSCFLGFSAFSLAFLAALGAYYSLRSRQDTSHARD